MQGRKQGAIALMLSLLLAGSAITGVAAAKQAATVKPAPAIYIGGGPKVVRRLTTDASILLSVTPSNVEIESITLHAAKKGAGSYDEAVIAQAEITARPIMKLKDVEVKAGAYVLVVKTKDGEEAQKTIYLRDAKPAEETKKKNTE